MHHEEATVITTRNTDSISNFIRDIIRCYRFGDSAENAEAMATVTISNMETDLNSGQAFKALLIANKGYLDIKVVGWP